jgi:hypothetical protein
MTASSSTHDQAASGQPEGGTLADLLGRRAAREEVERHLDTLSPALRIEQVLAIRGKGIKRLYEAVRGAPPVTLEEIVPPGITSTIILEGRNSLPTFSRFQKRFARVGGGVIVGYNHQTLGFATGPGYFVVKPAEATGELAGEILFDYTEAPPAEPAGWPRYVPNDRGLSRAVFMHMKDYCRRVAKGVLVGKAYKKGIDQNAYFTLTSATA